VDTVQGECTVAAVLLECMEVGTEGDTEEVDMELEAELIVVAMVSEEVLSALPVELVAGEEEEGEVSPTLAMARVHIFRRQHTSMLAAEGTSTWSSRGETSHASSQHAVCFLCCCCSCGGCCQACSLHPYPSIAARVLPIGSSCGQTRKCSTAA